MIWRGAVRCEQGNLCYIFRLFVFILSFFSRIHSNFYYHQLPWMLFDRLAGWLPLLFASWCLSGWLLFACSSSREYQINAIQPVLHCYRFPLNLQSMLAISTAAMNADANVTFHCFSNFAASMSPSWSQASVGLMLDAGCINTTWATQLISWLFCHVAPNGRL